MQADTHAEIGFHSDHIYLKPELQDEWIASNLKLDQDFFFVRYADRFEDPDKFLSDNSDCHVRVRSRSGVSWDTNLEVVQTSYFPEISRYGGPTRLPYAEDYFCLSSKFVVHQLSKVVTGRLRALELRVTSSLHTNRPVLSTAAHHGVLPEVLERAAAFHSHAFRVTTAHQRLGLSGKKRAAFASSLMVDPLSHTPLGSYLDRSAQSLNELAEPSILSCLLHMNMNRLGFLPIEEFTVFQLLHQNSAMLGAMLK